MCLIITEPVLLGDLDCKKIQARKERILKCIRWGLNRDYFYQKQIQILV